MTHACLSSQAHLQRTQTCLYFVLSPVGFLLIPSPGPQFVVLPRLNYSPRNRGHLIRLKRRRLSPPSFCIKPKRHSGRLLKIDPLYNWFHIWFTLEYFPALLVSPKPYGSLLSKTFKCPCRSTCIIKGYQCSDVTRFAKCCQSLFKFFGRLA